MRIVHVTTVPETLRFLSGQIAFMQRHGHEVHAVSSPGKRLEEFGTAEGTVTHGIHMLRRITPVRDIIALMRLTLLFRRLRPQIVHGHTPKGGLLAMIAACLAGVPIRLFHLHGLAQSTATGLRHLLRCGERSGRPN